MERMTKHTEDGRARVITLDSISNPDKLQELIARLAAYEDTGLEPEEINSLRMDMAIIKALFHDAEVERMKELTEADKDGRLVVLPCKVGDTVYTVSRVRKSHFEGEKIVIDDDGDTKIYEMPFSVLMLPWLGTGYFLTREEAEAALAEKGGVE